MAERSFCQYRLTHCHYVFTLSAMNNLAQPSTGFSHYLAKEPQLTRQLLDLTLALETRVMHSLRNDYRHPQLRLSFEPYISFAAAGDISPSDIARRLGLSRQAINQTVNDIEKLGYIKRSENPDNRRSKRLALTARGRKLQRDGIKVAQQLESEAARLLGERALEQFMTMLQSLTEALADQATTAAIDSHATPLLGTLPRLSDYSKNRLRTLLTEKGHRSLKPGYGIVFSSITRGDNRIQPIAARHGLSKQAVSNMATELEQLGYIDRQPHPADPRQLQLQFSRQGKQLMRDSLDAASELEASFARVLGARKLARFKTILDTLHDHFCATESPAIDDELQQIARTLRSTLGPERCAQLGQILANETHYPADKPLRSQQ